MKSYLDDALGIALLMLTLLFLGLAPLSDLHASTAAKPAADGPVACANPHASPATLNHNHMQVS
ncbi:MAG: hypothetical protein JO142_12940 [Burkholderiales bacterium]|nr:hypothetical protein [Burkholderiales bacterium]